MPRVATVDVQKAASRMSITVHVKKRRRTVVRTIMATWLIRLATFVGGFNEIKISERATNE